jgi:hypothetical protein
MGVKLQGVSMEAVGITTVSPYEVDGYSGFDITQNYFADANTGNGLTPFGPFQAYGHNGSVSPRYTSASIEAANGKADIKSGAVNGATVGLNAGQYGLAKKLSFKTRIGVWANTEVLGGYLFFGQVNTLTSVHSYGVAQVSGLYFLPTSGEFFTQRTLQNGSQERVTLAIKTTARSSAPQFFDIEYKTDGSSVIITIGGTTVANWPISSITQSQNFFTVLGFSNSNTQSSARVAQIDSLGLTVQR